MRSKPSAEDANLILRLYELRREPRMRQARSWFMSSFHASTVEEYQRLCPPGSEENASFRMMVTYWDMAASFVASGALNAELFYENNQELLWVWERLRDLLPEARTLGKNPIQLRSLEKVAQGHIAWLKDNAPEYYPVFSAFVRGTGKAEQSAVEIADVSDTADAADSADTADFEPASEAFPGDEAN